MSDNSKMVTISFYIKINVYDNNEFYFTSLQTILINKSLPDGFKLEKMENLDKNVDILPSLTSKKSKTKVKFSC